MMTNWESGEELNLAATGARNEWEAPGGSFTLYTDMNRVDVAGWREADEARGPWQPPKPMTPTPLLGSVFVQEVPVEITTQGGK